jgi:hypothetical protein
VKIYDQILEIFRNAAPEVLSESMIAASLPEAWHPEMVAGTLRKLRAEGAIDREESGYWRLKARETEIVSDNKPCTKCGANDRFPSGGCRVCEKAARASKSGKPAQEAKPKPKASAVASAAIANLRKKAADPAPKSSLIRPEFRMLIDDISGAPHEMVLSHDQVKRLAAELAAFA